MAVKIENELGILMKNYFQARKSYEEDNSDKTNKGIMQNYKNRIADKLFELWENGFITFKF